MFVTPQTIAKISCAFSFGVDGQAVSTGCYWGEEIGENVDDKIGDGVGGYNGGIVLGEIVGSLVGRSVSLMCERTDGEMRAMKMAMTRLVVLKLLQNTFWVKSFHCHRQYPVRLVFCF